mmetsp:Transcript_10314/g.30416  ORF Transcript_10314/g.30416 Transcript_10314/m.30416 type:complete len:200 (+) Transcript_10314:994-1593(+)
MQSWYPASCVTPSFIAWRCIATKPSSLVIVTARSGPVNSSRLRSCSAPGTRRDGRSRLLARALSMKPELTRVAMEVAAAAPAHPQRNGHTQKRASPITLKTAAMATIFKGVTASLVASNTCRATLCASAAQAMAPLQWMYDAASVRSAGFTPSVDSIQGVKAAYRPERTRPQITATVRGADAASRAALTFPPFPSGPAA